MALLSTYKSQSLNHVDDAVHVASRAAGVVEQ
jgi:hypothetical protein